MTIVDMAYPGRYRALSLLRARFSDLRGLAKTDRVSTMDHRTDEPAQNGSSRLRLPPALTDPIDLRRSDYATCIR